MTQQEQAVALLALAAIERLMIDDREALAAIATLRVRVDAMVNPATVDDNGNITIGMGSVGLSATRVAI